MSLAKVRLFLPPLIPKTQRHLAQLMALREIEVQEAVATAVTAAVDRRAKPEATVQTAFQLASSVFSSSERHHKRLRSIFVDKLEAMVAMVIAAATAATALAAAPQNLAPSTANAEEVTGEMVATEDVEETQDEVEQEEMAENSRSLPRSSSGHSSKL